MESLPLRRTLTAAVVAVLVLAFGTVIWIAVTPAQGQAIDGFERGIVTVTFDDGYQSIYDNALPIMQSLGITSTQFIVTGYTDTDPFYMTSAELVNMHNLGHEMGSHTVTHPDLTTLTPAQLDAELSVSKAFLEALTGPVEDFAYTFGIYNDTVIAAVQQYYLAARTSDPGLNTRTGFNEYLVKCEAVLDTTTPAEVQAWIDDANINHYWLVLLYHQVDDAAGQYHTTPANLALEMQNLSNTGIAVMPMKDALTEIRPWFRQYTVAATVTSGQGSASPASQTLGFLDPASVAINPANGFRLASITDNGIPEALTNNYTIGQVRLDHQVQVAFQPLQPSITSFSPGIGPPGTRVVLNGTNFQDARGTSTVGFGGVPATRILSWSNNRIVVAVPQGARTGKITVTTSGGTAASATVFQALQPDWYLAEGSTNWGFDTYISIANPNATALTVQVTYTPTGSPAVTENIDLPASSQTTLANDHLVSKFGNADFSTVVRCLQGKTIAVDRTMTWTGQGALSPEAHNSIGVTAPASTWYLPEGSSNWGFETWLLVQNPNATAARVTITYMTEGTGQIAVPAVVPAHSRTSYGMAAAIGAMDASIRVESAVPVIAERSVYRNNRREGLCSVGTTTPATAYYLAEGSSAWGFTTYLLVQNPGTQPADVTLTYMTTGGPVTQPTFTMPSSSRKTIRVNDALPNTDFSTLVTGSRPVIAERSMYWDNGTGEAGHDSIGIDAPHGAFLLPDGQTSQGRQTWTLVQNPNAAPVRVKVSYLPAGGSSAVTVYDTIPANSRRTYDLANSVSSGRWSTLVSSITAGRPVVVERSMYWNNRGAGTETIAAPAD